MKLAYEKGDLLQHPEIGANLSVGTKLLDLENIKDDVFRTLIQDSRIEQLKNFAILRSGSALELAFEVKIKQIDLPIPIKIRLRD